MSSTPKSLGGESLNGSWVEVLYDDEEEERQPSSTPLCFDLSSGVQKILLDAQKESSSPPGSHSSQEGSPESPDSPIADDTPQGLIELSSPSGISRRRQGSTDWIWDWSSLPDQIPPKEWSFHHPPKSSLSLRNSKTVKRLFSNEMLSVLIITNILSIVLGAGIGLFISRRLGSRIFS